MLLVQLDDNGRLIVRHDVELPFVLLGEEFLKLLVLVQQFLVQLVFLVGDVKKEISQTA